MLRKRFYEGEYFSLQLINWLINLTFLVYLMLGWTGSLLSYSRLPRPVLVIDERMVF